jgi:hypothetical protein
MVLIIAVHMEGGSQHEHIASVQWKNPSDGATGQSTKAQMVEWIQKGNEAKVTDGRNIVSVGVVTVNPPYLRTHADGTWTDNLLALPKF